MCGTIREVWQQALTDGESLCCGCIKTPPKHKGKDLIGEQFGRWEVLWEAKPHITSTNHKERMWHCRCICGQEKDVLQRSLKAGTSLSCGCLQIDTVKNDYQDLTGQVFGRLTALYKVNNKNGKTMWHCKCSCGNECDVSTNGLKTGNTSSCGCLRLDRLRESFEERKQLNQYDLSNDYGIGYTNSGQPFFFDLEDYPRICNYLWGINSIGYVVAKNGETNLSLHRLVMNAQEGEEIDHVNHLKHDDRKINLRKVKRGLNNANRTPNKNLESGCTGVYVRHNIKGDVWVARITVNYKHVSLGTYNSKKDAIAARKRAETYYWGEYSYDNSMELAELNKINV